MSEKKPSHEVEGIVRRDQRQLRTTKTLPRAGHLAKLSNRLLWRWENIPEGQPSLQHYSTAAGLHGRVARWKPLLSKRHMTARLEFAKRHVKHFQNMINNFLCSDETKIELFGLNAKDNAGVKDNAGESGLEPDRTSLESPENNCCDTHHST